MNRVGWKGKGESVWLGWFLYRVLMDFIPVSKLVGDEERADSFRETADRVLANIEEHGWDGEWYLRGYFDSGQPLGSGQNTECRIDSVAQSWSVISGGADPARAEKALESVWKYLVKEEDQLVLLLTPPFNRSWPDPGYIKGYLPGIRENGGQYTHAAAWSLIAFAAYGNGDRAYEMFKMLNPANHALTYSEMMKYKLEPYVIPADIYSKPPHAGRGGWSWYTGSAGWMYQAGIKWILGLRRKGERLFFEPAIPGEWKEYSIVYRYWGTKYVIEVENPEGICHGNATVICDGEDVTGKGVHLKDDGAEHSVRVIMRRN